MKAIMPQFKKDGLNPIYIQLYSFIKDEIMKNELTADEKLPSIRGLANQLKISVTTVNLAYQQLLVEGYIDSRPRSGYYVNHIELPAGSKEYSPDNYIAAPETTARSKTRTDIKNPDQTEWDNESRSIYDIDAFDFTKWKKSLTKVLNEHSSLLLEEGNPQGEYSLRYEISKYLYRIRGIDSHPGNIVIGAGTQQITGQLSSLLRLDNINDLIIEKPGYAPVHNTFRGFDFDIHTATVGKDGIALKDISQKGRCAVYTSPSNQFPTGAVMPVGKRYMLLRLAKKNGSYIIEDDYDSELRYFGRPIPPLKSLDKGDSVIYLSSFSSTLFPAIKISYMILPDKLSLIFNNAKSRYNQPCSKTEQLALAYYMESGNYHTHVKKLRRLYTQKLQATIDAFEKYAKDTVKLIHSSSGINMLIEVETHRTSRNLWEIAKSLGISTEPLADHIEGDTVPHRLIFHFNRIPLNCLDSSIRRLVESWS